MVCFQNLQLPSRGRSLVGSRAPSNRFEQTSEEWCARPHCNPGSPRLSRATGAQRKCRSPSSPSARGRCPKLFHTLQSRWLQAGRHSAGRSGHWTLLPLDRICTPAPRACRCRSQRSGCDSLPGHRRRGPQRGAWRDVCEASAAPAGHNQSPCWPPEGPGSSPLAHGCVSPSPSGPEASCQKWGRLLCHW